MSDIPIYLLPGLTVGHSGPVTFPLRFIMTKTSALSTLKIDTVDCIFLLKWHFFLKHVEVGSPGWYNFQCLLKKGNVDTNINRGLGRSFVSMLIAG